MCTVCWVQPRGHTEGRHRGGSAPRGFSPPGEEPPLIGISWISKRFKASGYESACRSGARSVALRKRYFQKRAFRSEVRRPACSPDPAPLPPAATGDSGGPHGRGLPDGAFGGRQGVRRWPSWQRFGEVPPGLRPTPASRNREDAVSSLGFRGLGSSDFTVTGELKRVPDQPSCQGRGKEARAPVSRCRLGTVSLSGAARRGLRGVDPKV